MFHFATERIQSDGRTGGVALKLKRSTTYVYLNFSREDWNFAIDQPPKISTLTALESGALLHISADCTQAEQAPHLVHGCASSASLQVSFVD